MEADREVCISESDPEGAELVELIESAREENKLRGVVFGIQRGDEPIAIGAVGDTMTGVPATREMHYRIGNISAGFLTTALLMMVDEGKLSIDDPLSDWFPQLPDADRITVEMLASSTSGYPHFPNNPAFVSELYADPFREWTADELIAFGTGDGTEFPPGTSWLFADTNLVILGQILEKIEGERLGTIIADKITQPLGLDSTESPLTPELQPPVLHGFTNERGVYEDATFWNPTWNLHSGSMASNLADLMRWSVAVGTGELLTPEMHDIQTAPRTVGLGRMTADLYYSFGLGFSNGWVVTNPRLQGYSEILAYLPSEELSVVLITTLEPDADFEPPFATKIFTEITKQIAPDNVPSLPS